MFQKSKIYDNIFYIWFSPYVDLLPERAKKNISPSWVIGKIIFVLKMIAKDVNRCLMKSNLPINGSKWLFVSTTNNYKSIEFLKEKIPDAYFVKPQKLYKDPLPDIDYRITYRRKIFYAIFGFFYLPYYLLNSEKREYLKKNWPYFFYGIGMYEESLRVLSKHKPKAIFFSNDHSVEQRSLLLAAKKLNIQTLYLQHASVSKYFPPLEFDLSLLEGKDAFNKYRAIGNIEGKVELVGMPKFDTYVKYRTQLTLIKKIGICYNPNDKIADVRNTIEAIKQEFGNEIKLIIRPHPADERELTIQQEEFSNSKSENVFDFLVRVDAIIAGDSSIHLEAVMLNRYSIYYNFSTTKLDDYYGYVKNGIAQKATSLTDLINVISYVKNDPPTVYTKAKYYNQKIGDVNENQTQVHVAQIIKDFLNTGQDQ